MKSYIMLEFVRSEDQPDTNVLKNAHKLKVFPDFTHEEGVTYTHALDTPYINRHINDLLRRVEPVWKDMVKVLGLYRAQLVVHVKGTNFSHVELDVECLRLLADRAIEFRVKTTPEY